MISEFHHLQSFAIALGLICVKTALYIVAGKENSIWYNLPILKGKMCICGKQYKG